MRLRRVCARRRGGTSTPLFIHASLPGSAIAGPGPSEGATIGAPPLELMGGVERAVLVGATTVQNLVQGAIVGAVFGLLSGAWGKRSLSGALTEARANGRSWGAISGMYAGLQTASRVIRNKDDRFNNVVGACGSGAAIAMKGGPRAAMQGCVSFAALSYLIDIFITPKEAETGKEDPLSPEVILRKK